MKKILLDALTVVGCCIGVGLLSGKEAQVYFGNWVNVAVFVFCFGAALLCVRGFCRKHKCYDIASLSKHCFGRFSTLFTVGFLMCCFVCVVTMLAGAQSCLGQLLGEFTLPVYSAAVALISALVLKKGLTCLKIINVVSFIVTAVYLVCVAVTASTQFTAQPVPFWQPIKYTLFSVTVSLGVLAPLSDTDKRGNAFASIIATVLLCVVLVVVLLLCDFGAPLPLLTTTSVPLKILGGIAVTLATVTGVVANALPLVQCTADIFQDDGLCVACIFLLALALSLFGFDFAMQYGYLFIATLGVMLLISIAIQSAKKRRAPKLTA